MRPHQKFAQRGAKEIGEVAKRIETNKGGNKLKEQQIDMWRVKNVTRDETMDNHQEKIKQNKLMLKTLQDENINLQKKIEKIELAR